MQEMKVQGEISYPALLWRKGYMYLAKTRLELCAHPRSLFPETVQRARSGEWHLADASGRYFKITDWKKVPAFGGVKGLGLRLLGSVFAVPVLSGEIQLPLGKFKERILGAVRSRYKYEAEKSVVGEISRKMESANSYAAAIDALPKL